MSLERLTGLSSDSFDTRLASTEDAVSIFRQTLQRARDRLTEEFHAGIPAPVLVGHWTSTVDFLVGRAFRHFRAAANTKAHAALIAVGGYGRGELHPWSDVDLVLLISRDSPALHDFAGALFRFLWDAGFQVGHALRTPKDCRREARADATVMTNFMESRLLCGDEPLFQAAQKNLASARLWPFGRFFEAKRAEQALRLRRFHDTAYNLEPNVKEGPGGLRDLHTIVWLLQHRTGQRTLPDLMKAGALRPDEYRRLMRARNFLWWVRMGLHLLTGRREDRLLFDHQRSLAALRGHTDTPETRGVEQFMKRYYRALRDVQLLNEIIVQDCTESLLPRRKAPVRAINRRFCSRNGYLETTDLRVFHRAPWSLLELFHLLQLDPGLRGVRADTIRLVRASLHRIDARLRRDVVARSLFLEILRAPAGLTHALRQMNAWGVLGAYLPVFGRIVGQMQHDLFHTYTVDEHTLFVVRNLRRMSLARHREELPLAHDLSQRVAKPERLYLAGLFHDIGKGRGGDHSTLGEQDAIDFCRLHVMSEYDTRFVAWLVRHHLLMSATAQRQDISDPEVVQQFAQRVGDQEHLDHLYLLTVADMRATSPDVWSDWKGRLLSQLHSATTRLLRRGIGVPLDREAHVRDLCDEALTLLRNDDIPVGEAQTFWKGLDPTYFLRFDAGALAWHVREIVGAGAADLPLVRARPLPEAGVTEFLFFCPDRAGLFRDITAGFDQLRLSIVDARIHTLPNGFALDTFAVHDADGAAVSQIDHLGDLTQALRTQLLHPEPGRDPQQAVLPRALRHFPIETQVGFEETPQPGVTAMEVTASDRPGLLYQVAAALSECGLNLVAAKIATYGERAEDIFFINRPQGGLPDVAERECLRAGILARLGR